MGTEQPYTTKYCEFPVWLPTASHNTPPRIPAYFTPLADSRGSGRGPVCLNASPEAAPHHTSKVAQRGAIPGVGFTWTISALPGQVGPGTHMDGFATYQMG